MARAFNSSYSQHMTGTLASTLNAPYTIACHLRTSAFQAYPGSGGFGLYDASSQDHCVIAPWSTGGVNNMGAEWQAPWAAAEEIDISGVSTGTWYQVTATATTAPVTSLYLDGGTPATGTDLIFTGDFDSVMIAARRERGGSGFDTGDFLDGDIAECAVWDVALSAADVASLGAGVSPLLVRPDSLIFYAPLRGKSRTDPEIDIVGGVEMVAQ